MKIETPYADRVPVDRRENLRWRAKILRRASQDKGFRESIIEACRRDPVFYINGFAYTYDPRVEPFARLPFILYPGFQDHAFVEILKSVNSHDLLIRKSRDQGVSWMCIAAFEWVWHFHELKSLLMVSRGREYVDATDNPKSLFWKIDFIHDYLPSWLMPSGYKRDKHRSLMHIANPENGSVIDGEATTGQAARGDRRSAILLDEFAACEQGHKMLAATRDSTKCRIINSTPQGTGNAYYSMFQTGIRKLTLHWSKHPMKNRGLYRSSGKNELSILDAENYPDGYKPILDGRLRSPWYDGECARAESSREIAQELDMDFLGSGWQYFDSASIHATIRKVTNPPAITGDFEFDAVTGTDGRFHRNENGPLKLWCLLDRDGNFPKGFRCAIGGDVSAGTGSSNSCLCGYNAITNEKVLEYVNPYIRPEEFARLAVALARWVGGAYLIWESNGPGRQFGSRVIELGYGRVYYRNRQAEAVAKQPSNIPGWPATRETKLVLMGNYRHALECGTLLNRSKEALEECLEYVFDSSGSVVHAREENKVDPTGARANHGDRVIADALAWLGLSERRVRPVPNESEAPIGSLAWRREMRKEQNKEKNREILPAEGW